MRVCASMCVYVRLCVCVCVCACMQLSRTINHPMSSIHVPANHNIIKRRKGEKEKKRKRKRRTKKRQREKNPQRINIFPHLGTSFVSKPKPTRMPTPDFPSSYEENCFVIYSAVASLCVVFMLSLLSISRIPCSTSSPGTGSTRQRP